MARRDEKKFAKMSLAKKIDFVRNKKDLEKIGWYHRASPEEQEAMRKQIGGLEHLIKINEGNTGSISKKQGGSLNVSNVLPWQLDNMQNAGRLSQTGLEDIINQLGQHYESPINNQVQQIFGHMQNPILQGLINPQHGNMAGGSLFPDRQALELQQYQQQNPQGQYEQSPLMGLLSALGNHAFKKHVVPWLNDLTPEDIQQGYNQYVEPGVNRAYEGAQNAYQGGMESLRGLGQTLRHPAQSFQNYADRGFNDIGEPQTWGESFQKGVSPFLQPAAHPLDFLKGVGQFGSNLYNAARGRPIKKF
jgi:hypothetical protein